MTGITEWFLVILEQYGVWGLIILTFLDSFIAPTPPEVLFIPLCIATPERALWLASITIGASVVGAIVGYLLGLKGGRPLLYRFFSEEKIHKAEGIIHSHGAMAILIVSFTPIPYKLITVTSGVLGLSLQKLIFWSILGRSARFLLEAGLIMLYGHAVKEFLEGSSFVVLTLFLGIVVLVFYLLRSFYLKKRQRLSD